MSPDFSAISCVALSLRGSRELRHCCRWELDSVGQNLVEGPNVKRSWTPSINALTSSRRDLGTRSLISTTQSPKPFGAKPLTRSLRPLQEEDDFWESIIVPCGHLNSG